MESNMPKFVNKRALIAGLVALAASCPAAAQAQVNQSPETGQVPTTAPVNAPLTQTASQIPTATTTDPGFQWGDAGIGAGGALLVIGAGTAAAGAARRRRGHRAVTG
jgi:hypothetical protein